MTEYKEIFKLKALLKSEGISFEFMPNFFIGGYSIFYPKPHKECVCNVIENAASFGGKQDLLEIAGLLTSEEEEKDSNVGYLTAEDVFNRIKKHWRSTNCDIAQNLENCEDCGFSDMEVTENA